MEETNSQSWGTGRICARALHGQTGKAPWAPHIPRELDQGGALRGRSLSGPLPAQESRGAGPWACILFRQPWDAQDAGCLLHQPWLFLPRAEISRSPDEQAAKFIAERAQDGRHATSSMVRSPRRARRSRAGSRGSPPAALRPSGGWSERSPTRPLRVPPSPARPSPAPPAGLACECPGVSGGGVGCGLLQGWGH